MLPREINLNAKFLVIVFNGEIFWVVHHSVNLKVFWDLLLLLLLLAISVKTKPHLSKLIFFPARS